MVQVIAEEIKDTKELTKTERDELAIELAANFLKWDNDRAKQIGMAKSLMVETYLNQGKKKREKGLEWKSDVKMNALYNIKRTKKSVIWQQMWSTPSQMFEVRGTNKQTEEMAKQQKAAIVDSLNKMNIGKQYDTGVDNLYDIGEIIFKTDWEQRKKIVKRQKKNLGFVLQQVFRMNNQAGFTTSMQEIELPYYENARVESISPFFFVFDAANWKLGDKESWKSIKKIAKRFETLESLKSNSFYNITKEMIADLESSTSDDNNNIEQNKEDVDIRQYNKYGNKYAVLYCHGDFKINGKVYKNYIAEVLDGKYLIRFEENPLWVCPFILCALEYDPITKRGISPLKSVYEMCMKEEELINTAFDAQALIANPPCWVNEDLVDENNTGTDGNILLAPGKFSFYKNDYSGSKPEQMAFSANGIADSITLLDNKIADVSSVSAVMYGNIEDSKRTATELSLADKGSSSQASKELDTINQDLTIPMIENVAELLAMFKDGADFVYAQEKGKNVEYKITNEIRQAQYNYYYEDRNALADRKARFQDLFQVFLNVGKHPELFKLIDWKEVITTFIENNGYDNPDKFFAPETPFTQMANALNQMPQPVQQQAMPILQNLMQGATQMSQQIAMEQKQQQQTIA